MQLLFVNEKLKIENHRMISLKYGKYEFSELIHQQLKI